MCSFANNEGGWLIFVIEEDQDYNIYDSPITKISRLGYNQQISEILKNGNVLPLPNFETKIIKVPKDNTKCYLLIHVLKGLFPPYLQTEKLKQELVVLQIQ